MLARETYQGNCTSDRPSVHLGRLQGQRGRFSHRQDEGRNLRCVWIDGRTHAELSEPSDFVWFASWIEPVRHRTNRPS